MANALEELRQRLDKKERELMQAADAQLEKSLAEVDSFVRLVAGRSLNLSQSIEMVRQQVSHGDEVQLLTFFAE